jgi:hypothetical protein
MDQILTIDFDRNNWCISETSPFNGLHNAVTQLSIWEEQNQGTLYEIVLLE